MLSTLRAVLLAGPEITMLMMPNHGKQIGGGEAARTIIKAVAWEREREETNGRPLLL